jgi:predicted transcriptional regulator
MVPVVRNRDTLGMADIEEGIEDANHGRVIDADELLARLRAIR